MDKIVKIGSNILSRETDQPLYADHPDMKCLELDRFFKSFSTRTIDPLFTFIVRAVLCPHQALYFYIHPLIKQLIVVFFFWLYLYGMWCKKNWILWLYQGHNMRFYVIASMLEVVYLLFTFLCGRGGMVDAADLNDKLECSSGNRRCRTAQIRGNL